MAKKREEKSGKKYRDPKDVFDESMVEDLRANARVENQVRSRIQSLLTSAGMDEEGVGKEVLFWLPAEFTEWYAALFLSAVKLEGKGRQGDGSEENVKVKPGAVAKKRKGETAEEYHLRASGRPDGGVMRPAPGGGKKYKVAWTVKNEDALELKGFVDKALLRIVMGVGDPRELGRQSADKVIDRTRGIVGKIVEREGGKVHGSRSGGFCRDCGKAMSGDWARCPFHDL